jgi:ribulose-phosphate 3-epimerase
LRPIKIAASILSADFTRLADEIARAERGGADMIHVDVMDGRFVPNMTIGPMIVKSVRRVTTLPIDVHLMVESPDWFLRELKGSGVDMVSVHPEATRHLHRTLQEMGEMGVRAGVALNPATPFKTLEYVLDEIDYLLVMTVNPGFGGQEFIPAMLSKIAEARSEFERLGLDVDIEVDGGVNQFTARKIVGAGANVLVAGTALFDAEDISEAVSRLRSSAEAPSYD